MSGVTEGTERNDAAERTSQDSVRPEQPQADDAIAGRYPGAEAARIRRVALVLIEDARFCRWNAERDRDEDYVNYYKGVHKGVRMLAAALGVDL